MHLLGIRRIPLTRQSFESETCRLCFGSHVYNANDVCNGVQISSEGCIATTSIYTKPESFLKEQDRRSVYSAKPSDREKEAKCREVLIVFSEHKPVSVSSEMISQKALRVENTFRISPNTL